ncbi:hypothetical protein [Pontibacillus yanchengensis]|nr:hypothetical protein [Pontibacillus yanchengensis]
MDKEREKERLKQERRDEAITDVEGFHVFKRQLFTQDDAGMMM